eukprot:COSAG01_NODE_2955_length_6799_cov_5.722090_1_plen_557_part_00
MPRPSTHQVQRGDFTAEDVEAAHASIDAVVGATPEILLRERLDDDLSVSKKALWWSTAPAARCHEDGENDKQGGTHQSKVAALPPIGGGTPATVSFPLHAGSGAATERGTASTRGRGTAAASGAVKMAGTGASGSLAQRSRRQPMPPAQMRRAYSRSRRAARDARWRGDPRRERMAAATSAEARRCVHICLSARLPGCLAARLPVCLAAWLLCRCRGSRACVGAELTRAVHPAVPALPHRFWEGRDVVELSSAEVASLSPLSLAHASVAQLQTLVDHHADTLKQLCSASVEMCQFWQGVSSSSSSSSSSSPPSGVTVAKIELGGALGDLQQMAEAAAHRQVTALSATVMELVQQHMSADLGEWGQLSWVERWDACLAVRERLGSMDPRARTCTPGHTGAEARAQWVHLLRGRPPIVNLAGADTHGEDTLLLLQKPATPRRLARAQWREARRREKAALPPPTGSLQPPPPPSNHHRRRCPRVTIWHSVVGVGSRKEAGHPVGRQLQPGRSRLESAAFCQGLPGVGPEVCCPLPPASSPTGTFGWDLSYEHVRPSWAR